MGKTVLVIAPHMDDEALGLGGTIARHVKNGDEVSVVFVANRIYNHQFIEEVNKKERICCAKAKIILGYSRAFYLELPDERLDGQLQDILIPLEEVVRDVSPKIVYIPFYGDNNQDHRAVFNAARIIARPAATQKITRVLMYETPSSTEQSPPIVSQTFLPNFFVNITDTLEVKTDAFSCYESETRPFPHPRSKEGLIVLAKKRGIESAYPAAEAFMLLRDSWE